MLAVSGKDLVDVESAYVLCFEDIADVAEDFNIEVAL
jgi:hypothetical protein